MTYHYFKESWARVVFLFACLFGVYLLGEQCAVAPIRMLQFKSFSVHLLYFTFNIRMCEISDVDTILCVSSQHTSFSIVSYNVIMTPQMGTCDEQIMMPKHMQGVDGWVFTFDPTITVQVVV